MDTGNGKFAMLNGDTPEELEADLKKLQNRFERHGAVFREGEVINIDGSKFKVKKITPTGMFLRLLPNQDTP